MKHKIAISFIYAFALAAGVTIVFWGVRSGGVDDRGVYISHALVIGFFVMIGIAAWLPRLPYFHQRNRMLCIGAISILYLLAFIGLARSMQVIGVSFDPITIDFFQTVVNRTHLIGTGIFGILLIASLWRRKPGLLHGAAYVAAVLVCMALILSGYSV